MQRLPLPNELQYAQPVRKIILPWPAEYSSPSAGETQYHSSLLFYDNSKRSEVQMLDLEAGKKLAWACSRGIPRPGPLTLSVWDLQLGAGKEGF